MAVKLIPLHDRTLARRVKEEETTRGEGEVIAAGKGKINEKGKVFPLDVKEEDRVLFGRYAGTDIKIEGEEFLIIREDEVLGILTGTSKSK